MPSHEKPTNKQRPGRGGRRPGAGAPPGNLNAVRHGARSQQIREGVDALLSDPLTGHLFAALISVVMNKPKRARYHTLQALHAAAYQHSERQAHGRV